MAVAEDEAPKKKKARHELGEDLSVLSIAELLERIELLKVEIRRLEQAVETKKASAEVAASFFKR